MITNAHIVFNMNTKVNVSNNALNLNGQCMGWRFWSEKLVEK